MTQAIAGKGTQLKREGVLVAEVKTINGPTATVDQIDVTNLDSNEREFIPGFVDYGEMTFDLNFVPDNRGGLYDDFVGGITSAYTIEFPDTAGTIASFDAIVTGYQLTIPTDDAITASTTLKLSGALTWNN